ncbi:hypothetical protein PN471_17170 [Aphanizomenon sp. CS-733/32]|nr:hypothetical protein [Aphanizomenon sp. CS-733/32]MDB9310333.1 hypothetical protein [Aphanizomenon sp. CS-733/32]
MWKVSKRSLCDSPEAFLGDSVESVKAIALKLAHILIRATYNYRISS